MFLFLVAASGRLLLPFSAKCPETLSFRHLLQPDCAGAQECLHSNFQSDGNTGPLLAKPEALAQGCILLSEVPVSKGFKGTIHFQVDLLHGSVCPEGVLG